VEELIYDQLQVLIKQVDDPEESVQENEWTHFLVKKGIGAERAFA
jgi:hypothetical protein